MGNRSVIAIVSTKKVTTESPAVCLFAHWTPDGVGCKDTVQRALDRGRDSWGDAAYLARIILSQLIIDEGHQDDRKILASLRGTGNFGILLGGLINLSATDGDNAPIVLNCATQKIGLGRRAKKTLDGDIASYNLPRYWLDFDKFVLLGGTALEVYSEKGPRSLGSYKKNPSVPAGRSIIDRLREF